MFGLVRRVSGGFRNEAYESGADISGFIMRGCCREMGLDSLVRLENMCVGRRSQRSNSR